MSPRARTSRGPEPPPSWRVTIQHHAVPPRWIIPAQTLVLPAVSEADAIEKAIGQAQSVAGCPPWRPCRRASLPFVTAERVGEVSRRRDSPALAERTANGRSQFKQLGLAA